ncbi:Vps51/Vps67, partial [Ostertagia ostertagi]
MDALQTAKASSKVSENNSINLRHRFVRSHYGCVPIQLLQFLNSASQKPLKRLIPIGMSQKVGVLDVTSADFDVDAYLSSQLKEKNLDELVKEEEEMVSSVRRLDSDVHQLVYENYNKFLTATSTVRKIQDEFNLLDSEMESLSRNMKNISSLIGELSGVLGGGREGVAQLGSSYKVVKSLQSIFELPNILQASFDEGKYSDVVRVYLLAQKGLGKYSDIKNISEIQKKTDQIIAETEKQLTKLISRSTEDVEGVVEATGLLIKLGKTPHELEKLLLKSSESSLQTDLQQLQSNPVDVLDLVDKGCESFIPNLTLLANLHERLFPNDSDLLLKMLQSQLADFHEIVSKLFLASSDPKDLYSCSCSWSILIEKCLPVSRLFKVSSFD